MDVQEILDKKIKELPSGAHIDGLRAVKLHIESAVRHLNRGQSEADDTLFTDVIFRCNQAFEGSIKEAYRLLAGKDPQKETPANIEKFLASGNLLRKKVLDQFTRYRQEWRNPSTHDYTLDFDEDEALLAIVTVTVFAIVLCDQIDSKIAFNIASSAPPATVSLSDNEAPLLELVTQKAVSFASTHIDEIGHTHSPAHDYYRLEGALAGDVSAELANIPGVTVSQNKRFASREADVVVEKGGQRVVIELKRTSSSTRLRTLSQRAVTQAALYLHEPDVIGAVVLIYSLEERSYEVESANGALRELVRIIAPASEMSQPA
ncbi:MAG: hypothetical protein WBX25_26495 [Rhodomicrobium sp.]